MKDRDGIRYCFQVVRCSRAEVREFIELNHYTHNINGVLSTYCYKVIEHGSSTIIAAALFGKPAMVGQADRYTTNPETLLELRRFVAIDQTPRNFESYVLSKMFKDLKSIGIDTILSYSDPEQGHTGTIYKALGFTYLGQAPTQRVIQYQGKLYHDKSIRTKYKGQLKPFAQRLKDALLSGEAVYNKVQGKHRFLKKL